MTWILRLMSMGWLLQVVPRPTSSFEGPYLLVWIRFMR